jgi:hypothetical protein
MVNRDGWLRFAFAVLCSAIIPLQAQLTLQITSPADNTVVHPGQTVNVIVTPTQGVNFNPVLVIGGGPIGVNQAISGPPYLVPVPITGNAVPGRYMMTASGSSISGLVRSNQIWIDVERRDSPVSLQVDSALTIMWVGEKLPSAPIVGTFADGSKIHLNGSTLTMYSSSEPSIVMVDSAGQLTAVAAGSANITITNGDASALLPVTVVPLVSPPIAIAISPAGNPPLSVCPRNTIQFTATVTNAPTQAVTWSLHPAIGSITAGGLYAPPASVQSTEYLTVIATSLADNQTSASAGVAVT